MNEQTVWTNEDEDIAPLISAIRKHVKTDLMKIEATKVDWQGRSGHKIVDLTENDEEIASQVIPAHECSFDLREGENGLYAMVSSHDVPTGSYWTFNEYIEGQERKDE